MPVDAELHVPPEAVLVKVAIDPAHTVETPVTLPASGNTFAITVIAVVVIAPLVARARPLSITPLRKFIAALLTTTVPLKMEPSVMSTAPSTNQNIFFTCAPFISITLELFAVAKAPFTFMTNTALELPCASRNNVSVSNVAAFSR